MNVRADDSVVVSTAVSLVDGFDELRYRLSFVITAPMESIV